MPPALALSALPAEEVVLDAEPNLASTESRASSPTVCGFTGCSRAGPSRPRSRACSRETSADTRELSPAARDALVRTRGVLSAARARVVELETSLVQCQRERTEQEAMIQDLQEQVHALNEAQLRPVLLSPDVSESRYLPELQRAGRSSSPGASPLQACEAAVARLEGLQDLLIQGGPLCVSDLEPPPTRLRTLCFVSNDDCSIADEPPPPAQPEGLSRKLPGNERLIAAAAARFEIAAILNVWTAWWSEWRARNAKAQAMFEVFRNGDLKVAQLAERRQGQEVRTCFGAWWKLANASVRCRQVAQIEDLKRKASASEASRHIVESVLQACSLSILRDAFGRWQSTVDVHAFARRMSAAHESNCDYIRHASTKLLHSSTARRAAGVLQVVWSAWRFLCRCHVLHLRSAEYIARTSCTLRRCWKLWRITVRSRQAELDCVCTRHCQSQARSLLGAWRVCARLSCQGRLHRQHLLEVLAPQCALLRMCLAAWERAACDSRIESWSKQCGDEATMRWQALDTLARSITKRTEATASTLLLAWTAWRGLSLERTASDHRRTIETRTRALSYLFTREALRKAWSSWSSWVQTEIRCNSTAAVLSTFPRRSAALAMLTVGLVRTRLHMLIAAIWTVWRALAAASSENTPFREMQLEKPHEQILRHHLSDKHSAAVQRQSTNGRPPTAISINLKPKPKIDQPAAAARMSGDSREPAPRSHAATALMRHAHSDPAIVGINTKSDLPLDAKPVRSSSHMVQCLSPAPSEFSGRLAAALHAHGLGSLRSSTNSSRVPLDSSFRCFSQNSAASCTGGYGSVSLSSTGATTPRDLGPSASERSTCCPPTPRSSCGGLDQVTVASGTSECGSDLVPVGPRCQPVHLVLEAQPHARRDAPLGPLSTPPTSLTAPVGPQVTPPSSITAPAAPSPHMTPGSLQRSFSTGANRSLVAGPPSYPAHKLDLFNSSPSWHHRTPTKSIPLPAWTQTPHRDGEAWQVREGS